MKMLKWMTTMVLAALVCLASLAATAAELTPDDTGHYRAAGLERQGVILLVWPDQPSGRSAGALVSWYTYEVGGPGSLWMLSDVIETSGEWVLAQICAGAFPGIAAGCEEAGWFRLTKLGEPPEERLRLDYLLPALGGSDCDPRPQASPLPPACGGSLDLERLTPPIL